MRGPHIDGRSLGRCGIASSERAERLAIEIADAKLGDIKRRAKEIGKNHDLAMERWATGASSGRLLSVPFLDKKRLSQHVIDAFAADIVEYAADEGAQSADWLLANQLM